MYLAVVLNSQLKLWCSAPY